VQATVQCATHPHVIVVFCLRGAHIHGSHDIRVWAEIMRSQKCGFVGKSQPVLIIINLIIFTRTRIARGGALHLPWRGVWSVAAAWVAGPGEAWMVERSDGFCRQAGREPLRCVLAPRVGAYEALVDSA
jgi:hypothetical protein